MSDLRLWLVNDESVSKRRFQEVVRTLEAEGVAWQKLGDATPSGVVLVVFGEQSPQLEERVQQIARRCPERCLAVAAGPAEVERGTAWRLLAAGASDVLSWEAGAQPEKTVAARLERWREVDRLLDSRAVRRHLVGSSLAWRVALRQVIEIARFSAASMLVTGETGTGKELVARLLHTLDSREDKRDLVLVDCTTIAPELSGSELFGHEKGAFTHAVSRRKGAFALADGGTLFLDEVGDLPPRLQAELLRVIQEGTYKRLGSNTWQRTDFRLVCATHRDLATEVEEGRFRRDLYYRLATWHCRLPPLRDRLEDVPALVEHFLHEELGEDAPGVDPEVLALLQARTYPGNVRDLRQLVTRIAHRHVGPGPVTVGDLPPEDRPEPGESPQGDWKEAPLERAVRWALAQGASLEEIKTEAADLAVRLAVEQEPDQQAAADRLGVSRRAVQLRLAAMRGRQGS